MVGIALLGAGRIGQVHALAIPQAGAKLVSVFDIDEKAARKIARQSGAHLAKTPEEAVERTGVDGVLVATSTDTHVAYIQLGIDAGKYVLCEKPVAPTLKETQACVASLGKKASRVQIGFNRRYDPNHAALKSAIDAGEIGAVEQITITSRDPGPPPAAYIRVSGGLFRDMTIHDFDMGRWLLGEEPVTVFAHGTCLVDPEIGKLGDIDSAVVTLATASGRQCVILNSRRATYGYDQRIEAFGAKGMLLSDNPQQTTLKRAGAKRYGSGEPLLSFFLERYADSYRLEIEAFAKAVRTKKPVGVNVADGLRALVLADAAAKSVRSGKVVAVAG